MLLEHAEKELQLAKLFDKDSDYNGNLGIGVMELMQKFCDQRHSGASAAITIELFTRLAKYQNLTPISRKDFQEATCPQDTKKVWQCTRNPRLFLTPDKTGYYDVDDKDKVCYFEDRT
jgi:hypothetical protein